MKNGENQLVHSKKLNGNNYYKLGFNYEFNKVTNSLIPSLAPFWMCRIR